MTEPAAPQTPVNVEPGKASPDPPMRPGLFLAIAVLSMVIATVTWYSSKQQVEQLSRQVSALDENQQKMAVELKRLRPAAAAPAPVSAIGKTIDLKGAPARGPAAAVATLVEFSDYECPFCIRHFQQTMPKIDANYIQTGKIRYVFRDFPIDQNHPVAIKAHEAARCALEQNHFWELHNALFSQPTGHTPEALEARAKAAGVDVTAYKACIASGRTTASIRESAGLIASLGGSGTPTFLLGIRNPATDQFTVVRQMEGALPYEAFAQALDAVIAIKK